MPQATRPTPPSKPPSRRAGLLAGMRIRKKLIFLHTVFSLTLAGILALALRPAIAEVIKQAESHEAQLILAILLDEPNHATRSPGAEQAVARLLGPNVQIRRGGAAQVGVDEATALRAKADGAPATQASGSNPPIAVAFDPSTGQYVSASVVLLAARDAVLRLYLLFTLTMLAVYALVATALELFVLPQHVYRPLRNILDADTALREGRREDELIAPSQMPADELGAIMRSRNESIASLRRHETDLAQALSRLEEVAADLTKKNHMLETARRNLAESDRLASLGMMSAGIAHELNTPLAVLKGLVEKAHDSLRQRSGAPISADEAALMLRVVGRLERLSESLLDFARVRPPASVPQALRPLIDEAWTLVRLDREAAQVQISNALPDDLIALCDPDRIMQVLVNVLRNAVDAAHPQPGRARRIEVRGEHTQRDDGLWASLTIADDGPGIPPELLGRLFQPFVSTRLDDKGTGLGLAVAEGIVREHGGVILARNRTGERGAVFEILLPCPPASPLADADLSAAHPAQPAIAS